MNRQFFFLVFIFLGTTVFAQTDWANIQPGGKNFNFQNPQVKIPAGYNDVIIGYGLQHLIPDRENYDPNLTYNYLDRACPRNGHLKFPGKDSL